MGKGPAVYESVATTDHTDKYVSTLYGEEPEKTSDDEDHDEKSAEIELVVLPHDHPVSDQDRALGRVISVPGRGARGRGRGRGRGRRRGNRRYLCCG